MDSALRFEYSPHKRRKEVKEAVIVTLRQLLAIFARHALGVESKRAINVLDGLPRGISFVSETAAPTVVASARRPSELKVRDRIPEQDRLDGVRARARTRRQRSTAWAEVWEWGPLDQGLPLAEGPIMYLLFNLAIECALLLIERRLAAWGLDINNGPMPTPSLKCAAEFVQLSLHP